MRRHRRKKLRYGLLSGFIAFAGGWAIATFLTPANAATGYPRWQTTLWVFLGAHLVELSSVYTGGIGLNSQQPLELLDIPEYIRLVPVVAVAVASIYTCNEISTNRLKQNVSNALGAGTGYFAAGLIAMVVSDIRPEISFVLLIGGGAALAVWLGSSFVGAFTRGLPVIGVASLGSIAALGILLLLGGVAILNVIWGLVAISFGGAAVTGAVIGVERELKRKGKRRNSDYPRFYGLRSFTEANWKEALAVVAVTAALYVGLAGGV